MSRGMKQDWSPDSWRRYEARQLPEYADEAALRATTDELAERPPLIFAGEARALTEDLAEVARGEAFQSIHFSKCGIEFCRIFEVIGPGCMSTTSIGVSRISSRSVWVSPSSANLLAT